MKRETREPVITELLRQSLKNQYWAGLEMLRETIEKCPDELWLDDLPQNAFWQVAYHTLFFTHLYLQPDLESFEPWAGQQSQVQHPDGIAGPADPNSNLPLIPEPYSRAEALDYLSVIEGMVDGSVDALDLDSQGSGFYWYPMPKLEHQLVNVRHLQHHVGQLADRLRSHSGVGTGWVGSGKPEERAD